MISPGCPLRPLQPLQSVVMGQTLLGLPRVIFHRNGGTKSITASPGHSPESLFPQEMGLNGLLLSVLSKDSWVAGEGDPGFTLAGSTTGVLAQSDTETIKQD